MNLQVNEDKKEEEKNKTKKESLSMKIFCSLESSQCQIGNKDQGGGNIPASADYLTPHRQWN